MFLSHQIRECRGRGATKVGVVMNVAIDTHQAACNSVSSVSFPSARSGKSSRHIRKHLGVVSTANGLSMEFFP